MKTMPIVVHALIFDMKNLLIRSSLFFTKDFCWLVKNWTLLYTLKTQWSKSLQDICIGFNEDWSMNHPRHGYHLAYSVFLEPLLAAPCDYSPC